MLITRLAGFPCPPDAHRISRATQTRKKRNTADACPAALLLCSPPILPRSSDPASALPLLPTCVKALASTFDRSRCIQFDFVAEQRTEEPPWSLSILLTAPTPNTST